MPPPDPGANRLMDKKFREGAIRTAVLGPGSLGLLWATYLSRNVPVCLVGRPGSPSDHIRCHLTGPDGSENPVTLPRSAPEHLLNHTGPVLVTTKIQDLESALAPLLPRVPEHTPIVLFQNGLGPQFEIAARYPDRAILAASTTEGANRPQPGRVVHAGRGRTWVGGLTRRGKEVAEEVRDMLADSGLMVETQDDIGDRLWLKLAINAGINPFTAILSCPNGALPGNPFFEKHLPALCDEIAAVARAHGRQFAPLQLAAEIRDVAHRTATNLSSMLQDVNAGKETEIAHINGFIVTEADRLGIPVPVNRMLTETVMSLSGPQR